MIVGLKGLKAKNFSVQNGKQFKYFQNYVGEDLGMLLTFYYEQERFL